MNLGDEIKSSDVPSVPLTTCERIIMEENHEKIGWKKNILWRGLNFLMALFFAMAAYVQLNDPDPILWMFVYAIPGTLCIAITFSLAVQDHYIWQTLATADVVASLAGAIYLATIIKPHMEKESITNPLVIEEGREMSGLIIVMLWMGICKIVSWCSERQGKLSLSVWISIIVLCLVPFILWAYCYRTFDKNALPGHCKDMSKTLTAFSSQLLLRYRVL